ncbi:carbohydrate esterase family 16 protein [Daedalea quercina L-15889]|uniref:Carbohydrate esterase family 16 protein n=1 Tax=Daedalea quercina L-15889 TaxID=1314783 RepID=A0A165R0W6_9APHY|nr:carbohydrate esterase family 16 protein [Daedalea quercina L-15889]
MQALHKFESNVVAVRKHWRGQSNLRHLVIFGASYCDVGYTSRSRHPTLENPLGVDFPGHTFAEPGKPNWVGHLITEHALSPILVYDYGLGGDRVDGVQRQIEKDFIPNLAPRPSWAPWTEQDTLFVTWVGINDCGYDPAEAIPGLVSRLFELQNKLYDHGARNFMLVDLPPVERSPSGIRPPNTTLWNIAMRIEAEEFAASHDEATVLLYSSWAIFTKVLDDPVAFGFAKDDVQKPAGSIWVDRLHPTSKMHDVVAYDMAKFLRGTEPSE